MRWCQVILGFERNKQAEEGAKNFSIIRLLKDRKYGKSGEIYMKYLPETGRLVERDKHEIDPKAPFTVPNLQDETEIPTDGNSKPF